MEPLNAVTATEAIAAGGPVYLDALDEAVLHEPALFRVLEHHLAAPAAAGVAWRLACRPAAWNPALATVLQSSLPAFDQLKLLPLSREAAAGLVAAVGVDPASFLDALVAAGLGRLAASPLRLQAAAAQWAATGHLPDSQLSAIRFEITQLLAETDPGRPTPRLSADRRYRLAARLAAITVFGKASRLTRAAGPAPGAIGVSELPSDAELDDVGRPVAPADYEEVLGTALFDAAADTSVSFCHQQYAEFLAAEYLCKRQIGPAQVPALLSVQADGALPGPVMGVAAWIGALNPDLVDDLAAANAAGLALAGVELPSDRLRRVVVDGVLTRAAAGDIDVAPGLDLSPLVHPALEAQLTGHLGEGLNKPEQLWWIAQLAAAGQCRPLASVLLQEVLGSAWPAWARRAGVAAVATLGGNEDLLQLQRLADLEPADDPGDDLLAAVIEALYPRLLGTIALLGILRPQRNTNYLGPYLVLLGELSGQIPPRDLTSALAWAAAHVQDGENGYGGLFPQLIRRGWEHAEAPATCQALAQLVANLACHPYWPHWPGHDMLPWTGSAPGPRRDLAISVAANLPAGQSYELHDLGLIVPGDLSWLLRELPAMPPPAQEPLARCVPQLAVEPTAGDADLILGMKENHPAYPFTQWLRQPMRTDSEPARLWRRHRDSIAEAEGVQTAGRQERQLQLAKALSDARTDPACWWRVALWLAASDSGHDDGTIFTHDLTARPGWSLLDDEQRTEVVDLGIRYLSAHQLQPSAWIGHRSVPASQVISDWSGVYLLTTLAVHDPGRLAAVEPPAWRMWAPAIVGAWNSGTEGDEQARCRLVDLVPPGEKQSIFDAALGRLDALQAHGGRLSSRQLYDHLCPHLSTELAERLLDRSYSGELAQDVLGMLVEHAPQVALTVCRVLSDPGSALAVDARRGLATLDPSSLIDDLEAGDATPADIASIAPHLNLSLLDDAHLAVLGRLLLRCVPFASDPQEQFGVYRADRRYQVRSIRRQVMDLLARHGRASFFEALPSQPGDPGHELVNWYLRQARAHATDIAYTGLDPRQLLQLLSRADARLVRHDQDLLEVILSELDQLQHQLTHMRESRYLWDFTREGGTPKSEDDISDWIRHQLELRLTPATIIDREIQVARRGKGIGTRIDVTATTPTATQPPSTARVIAEAKLVTSRELMTAMHDQLIQRYLIPTGLQYGIYLIYWIDPAQRPAGKYKGPTDRDELAEQLTGQAAAADGGRQIRPYILDISHP